MEPWEACLVLISPLKSGCRAGACWCVITASTPQPFRGGNSFDVKSIRCILVNSHVQSTKR